MVDWNFPFSHGSNALDSSSTKLLLTRSPVLIMCRELNRLFNSPANQQPVNQPYVSIGIAFILEGI